MTDNEKIIILTQNFAEFSKRIQTGYKQNRLTVSEIVDALYFNFQNLEQILSAFKKLTLSTSPNDDFAFCEALCRSELKKEVQNAIFIGTDEPIPAGAHSKISFVKNRFNELAYEKLSKGITSPKPEYVSSFAESCESITDGTCEFCILPISNSTDGHMKSFYSMLDRYELKISASTDIEDDIGTVKYARIAKACKPIDLKDKTAKYIFEFSVISSDGEFLAPLFTVADLAQATPLSIDSIPVEYASHLKRFFFTFSLTPQNATPFRLYVALKFQNYTPIGIYKEIK